MSLQFINCVYQLELIEYKGKLPLCIEIEIILSRVLLVC